MPEHYIRNNPVGRTADNNLILLAKNVARAYYEIGMLSRREYNTVRDTYDLDVINGIIGNFSGIDMEWRLKFCRRFVGEDIMNFNGATPAILAYAYLDAHRENTSMARALAMRIDDLSVDYAHMGDKIFADDTKWPFIHVMNITDVYKGFKMALENRISDLNATRDSAKIAQMKSNLVRLNKKIADYDDARESYDTLDDMQPYTENKPELRDSIREFWRRVDNKTSYAPVVKKSRPAKINQEPTVKIYEPEGVEVIFDDRFSDTVYDKPKATNIEPTVKYVHETDLNSESVPSLTWSQAQAWHDLNKRRAKVRKKLNKGPYAPKAVKLHAEESKLARFIDELHAKIGRYDDDVINRAAAEVLLREDLNRKQMLLKNLREANTAMSSELDWRAEIMKLNRNIKRRAKDLTNGEK